MTPQHDTNNMWNHLMILMITGGPPVKTADDIAAGTLEEIEEEVEDDGED